MQHHTRALIVVTLFVAISCVPVLLLGLWLINSLLEGTLAVNLSATWCVLLATIFVNTFWHIVDTSQEAALKTHNH